MPRQSERRHTADACLSRWALYVNAAGTSFSPPVRRRPSSGRCRSGRRHSRLPAQRIGPLCDVADRVELRCVGLRRPVIEDTRRHRPHAAVALEIGAGLVRIPIPDAVLERRLLASLGRLVDVVLDVQPMIETRFGAIPMRRLSATSELIRGKVQTSWETDCPIPRHLAFLAWYLCHLVPSKL